MRRSDLMSRCDRCAALCCIAPSFDASSDFAVDKAAGERCRYLTAEGRCAIHDDLAVRGFSGCAVYECHGAGQRVTDAFAALTDAGEARNQAFLVVREVHEMLWLLTEAAKLCPETHATLRDDLAAEVGRLDDLARVPAKVMLEIDPAARRHAVHLLLRRVGDAIGGRAAHLTKRRLRVLEG